MNVLVLGVSGFVGSWVAKVLLDQGFHVTGVVRSRSPRPWRVERLVQRYPELQILTVGEVSTRELVPAISPFGHFDGMVNCIGDGVNPMQQSVTALWNANVEVGCVAVEVAAALGIPRLIVAGSGFEYGFSSRFQKFDETAPLRPTTVYAVTKAAGFHVVQDRCRLCGIRLSYLRVFGVIGSADNPHRLLPYAVRMLSEGRALDLTDGLQVRDFIAAEDVGRAVATVLAWRAPHEIEVFNVSSARGIVVRDLVESIRHRLGASADLLNWGARPNRNTEDRFWIGDNAKLRQLGWTPTVSIETVILEAIAFYQCDLAARPQRNSANEIPSGSAK